MNVEFFPTAPFFNRPKRGLFAQILWKKGIILLDEYGTPMYVIAKEKHMNG